MSRAVAGGDEEANRYGHFAVRNQLSHYLGNPQRPGGTYGALTVLKNQHAGRDRGIILCRHKYPTILEKEENLFKTHRREITVVFLDLRGFTAFSDNAEPEEVMDLLRDYHAEMGKLIFKFEGTLERFVGDGIVVIFNDPLPCEDHGRKAVSMAIEMRDRSKELRIAWTKKGYDLDLGVGLATGYATLGTIGFEGRMDYSSVGNLPNLAARMCAEAKGGQILTDQKTMSRLEDFFDSEAFEEFQLKGLSRPVRVFNIVAAKA
jgi:class 3 adenylate cyclase